MTKIYIQNCEKHMTLPPARFHLGIDNIPKDIDACEKIMATLNDAGIDCWYVEYKPDEANDNE